MAFKIGSLPLVSAAKKLYGAISGQKKAPQSTVAAGVGAVSPALAETKSPELAEEYLNEEEKKRIEERQKLREKRKTSPGRSSTILTRREPLPTILST